MYTEWLTTETDHMGNLKDIPKLPPNKKVEVIFFVESEDQDSTKLIHRKPHPDVFGKNLISDDIFDSIPESDWYSDNDCS